MNKSKIKELAAIIRPFQRGIIATMLIITLTAGTVFAGVSVKYDVTIYDGEQEVLKIETLKSEPEKIIEQAGIELRDEDVLDLSAFTGADNSKITILRASTVTIRYGDDEPIEITVTGTVSNALEQAGVSPGKDDIITPTLETELADGMDIFVEIVEFKTRTETQNIAYTTSTEKTSSLFIGESKLKTKGSEGEKEIIYKDKFVNDELIESTVESEKIVIHPVNEVKFVGTAKKVKPINLKTKSTVSNFSAPSGVELAENGVPNNYSRIIEGRAAAYTGGGTTASGKKAQVGYIAVNPNVIPYGTKLYVVSLDGRYVYGFCEAADTGGFVNNGYYTIDVYMDTVSECYQWGDRAVRIYVLD